MDESVNTDALDALQPNGDVRLTQIQWIGVAGALATFIGMFAPLYGMLTFRITLASLGWPAIVIGFAAVAAAWLIVRRKGAWSLSAGLIALGVALYLLIRTEFDKASMHDQFPSADPGNEWAYPLGNGLSEMADAVVAPQWGWAVLLLGIGAILLASVALLRTGGKHARSPVAE